MVISCRSAVARFVLASLFLACFALPSLASPQATDGPDSESPSAQNGSPLNPSSSDSASADRKRRFEDAKRRLEQSESSNSIAPAIPHVSAAPNQTLFISPVTVNLVVGEARLFGAFSLDPHTLSSKVITSEVEWSLSDESIVTLTPGAEPSVVAKSPGSTVLHARLGSEMADTTITVVSKGPLPPGTLLWSVPQIQDFVTKQIVQAVPTSSGPDLYSIEENSQNVGLIRAFTSDGRQLWSKKMDSRGSGPSPFPNGAHFYAVPH